MPAGAVYVGRPTRWGNPFTFPFVPVDLSIQLYSNAVRGIWDTKPVVTFSDESLQAVYDAWRNWMSRHDGHPTEAAWDLRDKDLACWCPLDQPCHADVLLALANPAAKANYQSGDTDA
jgi:hypothetical protein